MRIKQQSTRPRSDPPRIIHNAILSTTTSTAGLSLTNIPIYEEILSDEDYRRHQAIKLRPPAPPPPAIRPIRGRSMWSGTDLEWAGPYDDEGAELQQDTPSTSVCDVEQSKAVLSIISNQSFDDSDLILIDSNIYQQV